MTTIRTWSAVTVGDVGTWHEITRVAIDQATRAAAASIAGAAILVEGADMVIGAMIRQRDRHPCPPYLSSGQALTLSHFD